MHPSKYLTSPTIYHVLQSNRNVLGIPVILPHTISSPDLPSPIMDSIHKDSPPLVTLHNTTLGSPKKNPSPIQLVEVPYKKKVEARSQSTLTLPCLELPGELLEEVNDYCHHQSDVIKKFPKRSRSLSPSVSQCHCYNCNVSELIFQDLSPSERFNLRYYFDHCCGLPVDNDTRIYRRTIPRRCSYDNLKNNITIGDIKRQRQQQELHQQLKSTSITRRMSCPEIVKSTECAVNNWHANLSLRQSTILSNIHLECISTNVTNSKHIKNHCYSLLAIRSSGACKHDKHAISARKSSSSRVQTQRSFSSPDTRPTIIQPDPNCTARRHRHGISGQMSYFKLLGYNVSKKLTGSANSLFSTAVISGSSSAPNLKDMVPPHASAVAAIEGFGGVPPIRPLETLHNALSLRQLDSFLEMMTSAPLFRTPASSPPKFPSPGGSHSDSLVPSLSIGGMVRNYQATDLDPVRYISSSLQYKAGQESEGGDHRIPPSPTSPSSTGWGSEPQSFLSSEPSSPAPTSAGESSMSMSLISSDGSQPYTTGPKFSTQPCLEMDFSDFCMAMDQDCREGTRGSISYTDYYSSEDGTIRKQVPKDGQYSKESMEEDEDNTLTLRQSEEQHKQDIKSLFEQQDSLIRPGSSYKKIGRFRVESMEIAEDDVRIKETGSPSPSNSVEKFKVNMSSSPLKKNEGSKKPKSNNNKNDKPKIISRSQSVSNPQSDNIRIDDDNYSYHHYSSTSTSTAKFGSFSTMTEDDLEDWKKKSTDNRKATLVSPVEGQEPPLLTVANTLKDNSNVTIGFDYEEKIE